MPGPLIRKPDLLPDYIDPAKASDEDSLLHTILRKAVSAIGLDDPQSQVLGSLMPMTTIESGGGGLSKLLQEIFAKNPAARGVYEKAMQSQLLEVLENRARAQTVRTAQLETANKAMESTLEGTPKIIPTETGHAYAMPKELKTRAPLVEPATATPPQTTTPAVAPAQAPVDPSVKKVYKPAVNPMSGIVSDTDRAQIRKLFHEGADTTLLIKAFGLDKHKFGGDALLRRIIEGK